MQVPNIVDIFLVEADELLIDLEEGLVAIEENPEDTELLNTIFRAAHTIKGSAGLAGFNIIVDFTHVMENILEQLRCGKIKISKELISVLLASIDVIKAMLDKISAKQPIIEIPGYNRTKMKLEKFWKKEEVTEPASVCESVSTVPKKPGEYTRVYEIKLVLGQDLLQTGQDPAMMIMELGDLGQIVSVEADPTSIPRFEEFDPLKLYLKWNIVLKTSQPLSSIENIFIFVQDESNIEINDITANFRDGVDLSNAEKRIGELLVEEGYLSKDDVGEALSRQQPVGKILVEEEKVSQEQLSRTLVKQEAAREVKSRSSIRVDTDKLDKLVNLVGELVTGVSHVNQLALDRMAELGISTENDEMIGAVDALDQISRDLQEQVMLVRMVPIEATFNRFKRVVRDMADDLSKKISLDMSGSETELDKNVIERLADPLKHIVRNSVDHGIEPPNERLAMGKDEVGKVWLRAKQQEGNIIIEISDDGRGIDKEAVLAKAREKGLIDETTELSDKEIYGLLFQPGFSTATKVTDVSGRGVGMDVVRNNIEELRGTVDIESTLGKGSTFKIRLPLTLAIIEGMNVQVGTEVLTIPLLSIIEQIRPNKEALKTIEGSGEVVDVRGEYLPLVRLHELFRFSTDHKDPSNALVIVIENEEKKYGLLVDTVLGQQQAVIRALDQNFRKIDGVSGATILGNGNISLILDPHRIEQMAFN